MLLRIAPIFLLVVATPLAAAEPDNGGGAPIEDDSGSTVPSNAGSGNATTTTSLDELAKLKALEEARKATFDAAKAAADSRKAAVEAQTAASVAKIGTVTGQSSIQGTVTMGTYGAKAEGVLLVTRSTRLAAQEIAPTLKPALDTYKARSVLILNGTSDLATPDAIQFDLQVHSINSAITLARAYFAQAKAVDTPQIVSKANSQGTTRAAPLAIAGALLDGVTKLGSYFMTDYSFGSVEVSTTSQLVANALVSALRQNDITNEIVIPANVVASDAQAVFTDLDAIQVQYLPIPAEQAEAKARFAELSKGTGPKAVQAAALYSQADAAATRATTAYEKLMTGLLADPAEGKEALVVRIVRQKTVQAKLKTAPLLLLLNSEEAAAYYTKKNLWTFLGGPPLYTMGGVSLTYTLYENNGGAILAAGTVAKHGGYRSVKAVEKLFP